MIEKRLNFKHTNKLKRRKVIMNAKKTICTVIATLMIVTAFGATAMAGFPKATSVVFWCMHPVW